MQKHSDTNFGTSSEIETPLSDALFALLTAMSRPGMKLITHADGTNVVVSAAKNGAACERRIANAAVASARRKGLIDAETAGSESQWHVTERGRAAYRRALMSNPARPGDRSTLPPAGRPASLAPRTAPAQRPPERRSVIEQLALRKDARGNPLLDDTQLAAGKRLAEDFAFAHLYPRVTARWSAEPANTRRRRVTPGAGVEISAAVSAAGERVRRALSDLGGDLADLTLDVCCFDKALQSAAAERHWSTAQTRLALALALGRLAQHYGMIVAPLASGRLRQWADAGFKPTAETWITKPTA